MQIEISFFRLTDEKDLHKMAPDLALSTGCFVLEKNRHSPRIFNKLATKQDISKVNTKLDFMKSLNLYCTLNSEESCSKVNNWEVVLPRNSLPLKQCSVVISVVKCDVCGQSLNNQTDVMHHKNLHNRLAGLTDNGYASGDDSAKESSEKENMQESCIECNNNNNLEDTEKVKTNKRHGHRRRRSKDAVTKVTLKIGGEIISKVYCKKKYLNKICLKEDKTSRTHHHEDCKNCNEIKDILRNNKINNAGAAHAPPSDAKRNEKSSDTDQSDCNIARLRKMAAALVELELRQKTYHVNEGSDFFSGDEFSEEKNDEDDAVVPIVDHDLVDSNDIDDDIQAVLRKSRSTRELDIYNTSNESNSYFEREIFTPVQDCEVITIDDEGCDLEDDCIIVEERLGNQSLRDPENSYVFHVKNKDDFTKNDSGVKDKQALPEKRLLTNDLPENDKSVSKKRKTENDSSLRTGISENLETHKIQKENKNYQTPSIKLSQFALPLRLINF